MHTQPVFPELGCETGRFSHLGLLQARNEFRFPSSHPPLSIANPIVKPDTLRGLQTLENPPASIFPPLNESVAMPLIKLGGGKGGRPWRREGKFCLFWLGDSLPAQTILPRPRTSQSRGSPIAAARKRVGGVLRSHPLTHTFLEGRALSSPVSPAASFCRVVDLLKCC